MEKIPQRIRKVYLKFFRGDAESPRLRENGFKNHKAL
jgi:hypothetical protein